MSLILRSFWRTEKGLLVALRIGPLQDEGRVRLEQISLGKLNNVREAIRITRETRTILGQRGGVKVTVLCFT